MAFPPEFTRFTYLQLTNVSRSFLFWGGLCYVKQLPLDIVIIDIRSLRLPDVHALGGLEKYMHLDDIQSDISQNVLQLIAKKEDEHSQVTNGRKAGKKTWEQIISHRVHVWYIYQHGP